MAQSAMGPFYCPADQRIYIDTVVLPRPASGASAAAAARPASSPQAYVIAHEVGHHVQNLLGILPQGAADAAGGERASARPTSIQVRVELQADCFAGVWAHHAERKWKFIEPGDVEAAMQTAAAIGDDTLQQKAQGRVVPDSLHPRLVGAAPALVHDRPQERHRVELQHLLGGAVVSVVPARR